MFKFTSALATTLLAFANAATDYEVRVRNLTYMQPFSRILVAAHTPDVEMFHEGLPATDAMKLFAEEGNISGLANLGEMNDIAPFVCGAVVGDTMLLPGETTRLILTVDEEFCDPDNIVFSLGSMLVNTNDAFVGIDSHNLQTTKVYPAACDAGTEFNNELCSHIGGPACGSDSDNMEDGPGEGYIHIHRGVHGIGNISASTYDWRNPVAEVFVSRL